MAQNILNSFRVSLLQGDENREEITLNHIRGSESALVLDFWHTKCVKCPAAMEKLNDAATPFIADSRVKFVSCALSQGPGNIDVASEVVMGSWENLTHTFMSTEEKERAKLAFGFSAVPFVVVFDSSGAVVGSGAPKDVDFVSLLGLVRDGETTKESLPVTSTGTPAFVLDEDF